MTQPTIKILLELILVFILIILLITLKLLYNKGIFDCLLKIRISKNHIFIEHRNKFHICLILDYFGGRYLVYVEDSTYTAKELKCKIVDNYKTLRKKYDALDALPFDTHKFDALDIHKMAKSKRGNFLAADVNEIATYYGKVVMIDNIPYSTPEDTDSMELNIESIFKFN